MVSPGDVLDLKFESMSPSLPVKRGGLKKGVSTVRVMYLPGGPKTQSPKNGGSCFMPGILNLAITGPVLKTCIVGMQVQLMQAHPTSPRDQDLIFRTGFAFSRTQSNEVRKTCRDSCCLLRENFMQLLDVFT